MTEEINDLKELITSIDDKHLSFDEVKIDILNQLNKLQTKVDNLPIPPVIELLPQNEADKIASNTYMSITSYSPQSEIGGISRIWIERCISKALMKANIR